MNLFNKIIKTVSALFGRWKWSFIFISLILVASCLSVYFFLQVKDAGLRSSFIQTTWTVIGVFIGAMGVYDFIIKQNRYIYPELLVQRSRRIDVVITGQCYEVLVDLSIRNSGSKSIKPDSYLYYTILVPDNIYQSFEYVKNNSEGNLIGPVLREEIMFAGYRTFAGIVDCAIHPERIVKQVKIKLKFLQEGEHEIRYFFNSEEGYFPSGTSLDSFVSFGVIPINVKKVRDTALK